MDSYTIEYHRVIPDKLIDSILHGYDDIGFDSLPERIKQALMYSGWTPTVREPTELEKWETVVDAFEHRVMNNELTVKDYLNKYTKGRNPTCQVLTSVSSSLVSQSVKTKTSLNNRMISSS